MIKIKAWRFYRARYLKLEEVELPEPKEGEALLRVLRCGVCQTDIDEFIAGPKIFNRIPFTPGHEFGGIVEKVGDPKYKYLEGKLVGVLPLVSCGVCNYCKIGLENLCEKRKYYGVIDYDGGFAEYAIVKTSNLFPVEDERLITLVEPLLVALRAFNRAKEEPVVKKKTLVVGGGIIGLLTAFVFRHFGWDVSIIEERENRKKLALELGFKVEDTLLNLKDRSYPVVVDAAGEDPFLPYALSNLFPKVAPGGMLILIGVYGEKVHFSPLEFLLKEAQLKPTILYTQKEVKLLPKILPAFKNISHKFISSAFPLEKLVENLIELELHKDKYIKLVMVNK